MYRRGSLVVALAAALLAAFAAPASAGHYRWTTSGPEPGLIYQIVVHPSHPNRMLVLAGIGGRLVFASQDGGETWSQSENLLYATRLLQDPNDPQTLYTIGSSGSFAGILKSVDGGTTWFPSQAGLPPDFSASALAAAPSVPGTLYVVPATSGPAYISIDGAATWTPLAGEVAGSDMVVDPLNPLVLYVATITGVSESTDGGASFVPLAGAPDAWRLFLDGRTPSTLYATRYSGGLSKSTDGGATWHAADSGFAGQTIYDLALDPADPQKLYAASVGAYPIPGGVFVSTNRAGHWDPVTLDVPVNDATAVAIDPEDASRVYAGAGQIPQNGAFHASADGGQSWATLGAGLSGYISHEVQCDPANDQVAIGASNAALYRTGDGGGTWTLLGNSGVPVVSLAVDPSNPENMYIGYLLLGVPGIVKSVDGGATWNPASDGVVATNMYKVAVSPTAPDHLLAATDGGIFGSTDAAGTWSPLLAGGARAVAFDSADASILYAGFAYSGSGGGELQRSDDGGATWNAPSGVPAGDFYVFSVDVSRADSSRVYAALGSGVYRSTDRGLSFSAANSGLPAGFVPLRLADDPTNPMLVLALESPSSPPYVWLTRDGATTWIPVPSELPLGFGSVSNVGAAAGGRTFYASTGGGIFTFQRSFIDVPDGDLFWTAVDAAAMNGVTAGCGSGLFCPTNPTTRASVAAFLLRGKNGALYKPPPATGSVFGDVPVGSLAADFIEELFHEGITSGCGGGDYCPSVPVTRAGMAALVLKTLHGADFVPPAATGTVFADVPIDAFAAAWIEELFHEGISAGCGGGNYCPDAPLSRAQASALIVHAFGLS